MNTKTSHYVITTFIALVWLINGLVCKVLNLVPRHQEIVGTVLGSTYAREWTLAIGVAEIGMALWFYSRWQSRISAWLTIMGVALMNIIEFLRSPELLLWGKLNSLFALLFIVLVYYNEYILQPKDNRS